jgi:RNA 2',3'-cyclic 3'-phosphodiesterase
VTRRTFIATDIFPGERLNEIIRTVKNRLSIESIRWTDINPSHITLSFLGDTTEAQVDVVRRSLKNRLSGFGEFEVRIGGVGFFGTAWEPRVLWIGVEMTDQLNALHLAVKSAVLDAGMVPDNKPFRPHLTIGRVRRFSGRDGIKDLLSQISGETLQKSLVREVTFYESVLKPEGAVYKTIEVTALR